MNNEIAEKWGKLIEITPFAVTKDGVRHRVTFEKGEMFFLVEFNQQDEFAGWFYGNRMMGAEVPLMPISQTRFYADGFKYDEGAAWGEMAVFLEFNLEREKVTGVTLEQGTNKYSARRISQR